MCNSSDPFGLCPDKNDPKCDDYGGPVKFTGVEATAVLGTGVSVAAGVFTSDAGSGPYMRVGGGFGGDVAAGGEVGLSSSLNAFRGVSDGACAGAAGVGGCVSENSSGKTASVGLSVGSRDVPLPISMHVERSFTFAPTLHDIAGSIQRSVDNMKAQVQQFERDAYRAMTRIP
jgi:hypothetical protein